MQELVKCQTFNIMEFSTLGLLFDFGMLVLIWIVQLLIYPSFAYFSKQELISWHQKYTIRITFVVMPLMVAQLTIGIIQVWIEPHLYQILNLLLLGAVWLSTFLQFVPMHQDIAKGAIDEKLLHNLVHYNWTRVFLWTLVFLLNAIGVFS